MARIGLLGVLVVAILTTTFLTRGEGPIDQAELLEPGSGQGGALREQEDSAVPEREQILERASSEPVVQRSLHPEAKNAPPLMRVYPGQGSWQLLVVDGATDDPVPGAEVVACMFGWGGTSEYLYRGYFGPHHADFFQQYALRTRTGPDGRATIPSGYSSVLARHHGASGTYRQPVCGNGNQSKWTEPTLRLMPLRQVEVFVTDDRGNPVPGARLGVIKELGSFTSARSLGCTDESGRTILQMDHAAQGALNQGGSVFVQTLGVPYVHYAPGHSDSLPDAIRLQLPPSRRLTLELRDPKGDIYREPVLLEFFNREPAVREKTEGGAMLGSYVIPAVGRGADLFIRATSWDGSLHGRLDPLLIPAYGEDPLLVPIQMEWSSHTIRGRLLDDKGTPIAHTRVRFTRGDFYLDNQDVEQPFPENFHLITDAEGRFSGPQSGHFSFDDGWRGLSIHAHLANDRHLGANLPHWSAHEYGPLDLGDISLGPDF